MNAEKAAHFWTAFNHSLRLMKVIFLVRTAACFVLTFIFIILIVVGLLVAFSHRNKTSLTKSCF
jgi:hypothetical protein